MAEVNNNYVINVSDVDQMKRKPLEWAKIYCVKLIDCPDTDKLMNEYEWAWTLLHNYKYMPIQDTDDFETAAEKELRAEMLAMDIYLNAEEKEKYLLDKNNEYIITGFIRYKMLL